MAEHSTMTSTLEYLRAQACNAAWANHRLLSACLRLSEAEFLAQRTSFFPSIQHTLNHSLTVDWFYVSALEGNCIGYAAFAPEIPMPICADLARAQRAVDERLIAVCSKLTAPAQLAQRIALVRPQATVLERVDRVLLHLFQHQIHHRGQVHAMLAGTAVAPPQLDEFFLEEDAERRAADLIELGLTEAAIWQA
jgi:uncharacterized damage-inducible protein DinB